MRNRLAGHIPITGRDGVLDADLDRVDPQLLGDVLQLGLAREGHLRGPVAAVTAEGQLVRIDEASVHDDVGDLIRTSGREYWMRP